MSDQAAWIENRPSQGWLQRLDFRELWTYRELAWFLAQRDLKLRYRQTAFGVAWAIIQPLAGVAIFSLVFGHYADLPSDGLPYPVFAYSGLVIWTYFSTAVGAAAQVLVTDRALVTRIYFPRILAPFASVLPGLLDLAISLVILAVFMALYDVGPGAQALLLPVWIGAAVIAAFAFGLWLSALNVQYRDVRYVLGFLTQFWLFASPVAYPSSLIDGTVRYLYSINPMVGVIDGFRWSTVDGPPPGSYDLVSLAVGLLVLVGGVAYFGRAERRFADVI